MKKLTLALAAFGLFIFEKAVAQTAWPSCGDDAVRQNLLAESPDFEQKQADFEAFYLEKMEHAEPSGGSRTVLTVPVVFHVVHQYGPENISDAQILLALDHLNWAFSNSEGYAGGLGADVEIRFCLATQKPDGGPSTGIERDPSVLTDLVYPAGDLPMKNLSRYDPKRFVNIWIVRSIAVGANTGVAGYAFLPTEHGSLRDGIVIEASFVGVSTASSAGLAHEMGHYLGLLHTFEGGCANSNCLTSGDRICDTPPDNSTSWAPCGGPWPNTCATDVGPNSPFSVDQPDMVSNFMDYGDWSCFNDFTAGQAARMRFSLENARSSLLASTGCAAPCPSSVTAFFNAPTTVTAGETVFFQSQTTGATAFEWKINGQTVATMAIFSHTFSAAGFFKIELKATGVGDCATASFVQNIEAICPTVAAFLAALPTVLVEGDSVFFKNTTVGATVFSWKVNGQTVSTASDFTFSSAAAGSFSICMEVTNGLCASEKCQILDFSDLSNNCLPTVLRAMGSEIETVGTSVLGPDGSIWHVGKDLAIHKILPNGLIEKAWQVNSGSAQAIRGIFDSDGHLVVVGMQSNVPFAMRFDTAAGAVDWFKLLTVNDDRAFDVIERGAGGPFLVAFGHDFPLVPTVVLSGPAKLVELDRATGAVNPAFDFQYSTSEASHFRRILQVGKDVFAFGSMNDHPNGLVRSRPFLTKIDSSGAVVFSKKSFAPIAEVGWLTGMDLAEDGDALVGLVQGKTNGLSAASSFFWLQKMDLNGNVLWIKEIEPNPTATNPAVYVHDLRVVADGYLVAGFAGEAFLMKISKDGETVLWATEFPNTKKAASATLHGRLQTDGKCHFLVADRTATQSGLLFAKTDRFGKVQTNCPGTKDQKVNLIPGEPFSVWEDVLLARMPTGVTIIAEPFSAAVLAIVSPPNCPICEHNCQKDAENELPAACSQPTFSRLFDSKSVNYDLALTADDRLLFPLEEGRALQKTSLDGEPVWLGWVAWPAQTIGPLHPTIDSGCVATNSYMSGAALMKFDKNGKYEWDQTPFDLNGLPISNWGLLNDAASSSNGETAFLISVAQASWQYFFQKISKSGDTLFQKAFLLNAKTSQLKKLFALKNGDFLAVGTAANFTWGDFGGLAIRFSPSGEVRWERRFRFGNQYETIRQAVEMSDGSLVFLLDAFPSFVLLKTTANGSLLFSKKVTFNDFPDSQLEALEMVRTNDGFATMTRVVFGGAILSKFSENGDHFWSREHSTLPRSMVFWPKTEQFFLCGAKPICGAPTALQRTDSLGRLGDCSMTKDRAAALADAPLVLIDSLPIVEIADRIHFRKRSFIFSILPTVHSYFECRNFCPKSCPLDLALRLDSIACGGGSTSAFLTVCNESDSAFAGDVRVVFFDKNPIQNAVPAVAADSFFVHLEAGQCLAFEIELPSKKLVSGSVWAFLNEKAVPLNFDGNHTIDTSRTLERDCRRPNNLSKINFAPPAAPVFDLGADRVFCGQNVVELRAPSHDFWRYEWSDGSTDSTLTVGRAGLFRLKITNVCGAETVDSVRVRVDSTTALNLPDLLICRPTEVKILGDFSKIKWLPSAGLSCADCLKPTIEPPTDGLQKYLVIAETATGCLASDTFLVRRGEARVTNAFTPDGDGLNDFFDVFTPEGCPCRVVEMRIFDRWGQIVFEKSDFASGEKTGWDGLVRGQKAPPDVYLFRIELEFSSSLRRVETGDLTLIR